MGITVKENYRLGSAVSVSVLDEQSQPIYSRYVPAADWDADPKAVAAEIHTYLASAQAMARTEMPAINKTPVVLTDAEIESKLAERNSPMNS